jgi:hypothetical protein
MLSDLILCGVLFLIIVALLRRLVGNRLDRNDSRGDWVDLLGWGDDYDDD